MGQSSEVMSPQYRLNFLWNFSRETLEGQSMVTTPLFENTVDERAPNRRESLQNIHERLPDSFS